MYFDLGAVVTALSDWGDMLVSCCMGDGALFDDKDTHSRATPGSVSCTGSIHERGGEDGGQVEVPRRRAMFIVFTDTTKALQPISEGHEEEDDCEVRLEAPVTTATAYVSLSAPDAVEEHHDTAFQGASMTLAASGPPKPTAVARGKGRNGDLEKLVEAARIGQDESNKRRGNGSRKPKKSKAELRSRGRSRRRDTMGPDSPSRPKH